MNIELIDLFFYIVASLSFLMGSYSCFFQKKVTLKEIVKDINDFQLKR